MNNLTHKNGEKNRYKKKSVKEYKNCNSTQRHCIAYIKKKKLKKNVMTKSMFGCSEF